MSQAASARTLRNHIASLETMTRFVLATLALASGVYTYLGVRSLLDGSATMVFFAAVIYSVSVSVGPSPLPPTRSMPCSVSSVRSS